MTVRIYLAAALITLAGLAMLVGAVVIASVPASAPVPAAGLGGEVWGEGYFPNIPLVTHEGEEVRFFDDLIRDKVVAISFIYTSCPDTCPVQTARMLQVARVLGDRLGKDVFFYSITIDPEYDTREVLEEFVDSWNIPDGWTFLTGDREDIVALRRKLGMRLDDVRSQDLSQHTVNLLIGNQKTGRWMKRSPFENAYVLADQLGSWLHGWKQASAQERDYAEAPEIRQISDGEYIFRNQCSACHSIGEGDVVTDAQRLGPDLYDVSRYREREWLERWLKEPDVMLAEEDPIALGLLARYRGLPMPNLRLTDKDVTALLGYIDRESRRITDRREGRLVDHRGHGEHGGHAGHAMAVERAEHAGHPPEIGASMPEPAEQVDGGHAGHGDHGGGR